MGLGTHLLHELVVMAVVAAQLLGQVRFIADIPMAADACPTGTGANKVCDVPSGARAGVCNHL